jgi:hypothetical protein
MAMLKYPLYLKQKNLQRKSAETIYKDEIKFSYGRFDGNRIPPCIIFIPADRSSHLPGSFIVTEYRAVD